MKGRIEPNKTWKKYVTYAVFGRGKKKVIGKGIGWLELAGSAESRGNTSTKRLRPASGEKRGRRGTCETRPHLDL